MFVTYTPEGGAEQRWEFDPSRVRAGQAEAIERKFGDTWDSWLIAVQKGGMRARRVLLWHLLTLDHPAMRFEDVPDFYAGELQLEYSAAELSEIRDTVAGANLPETERNVALGQLDALLEAARQRGGEPEGKAPSPSSATRTRS